ncbi:MAG: zinc ribbon domain-containing protein [Anaerolineales bacterium]|nr:zinc ribbon domain-containing protein [Anaerolineales bacterium]
MEIGGLLISLAILVLVVAFVARPLVDRQAQQGSAPDSELSALQAERDRVLSLLQDLEMDLAMSKIPVEDYQAQRAPLVAHGAEILRQIDGRMPGEAAMAGEAANHEDALEREIARRRSPSGNLVGNCPRCGNGLQAGDRFCVRCGTPVPVEASA